VGRGKRRTGHTLHDDGSVDEHERQDPGGHTHYHPEAIEAENSKDTTSFGTEDLEKRHRLGTEAGLLGIYSFPGAVYATDGSNNKGVMGAGFYRLDKNRGPRKDAVNLEEERKVTPQTERNQEQHA